MIPVFVRWGLLALSALFLLNCRTGQLAYVQPTHSYQTPASSLPVLDDQPAPTMAKTGLTGIPVSTSVADLTAISATPVRHQNPDARPVRRSNWFQQTRLYAPTIDTYTAPRLITTVSTKRTVPKGTVYALAGGVLPYGLLLVSRLPAWAWWVSLSLPVASLFMAAGSLARIRRNREQYRGRGWAIAAMLLATSYLGMGLYTAAAIAASGMLWE